MIGVKYVSSQNQSLGISQDEVTDILKENIFRFLEDYSKFTSDIKLKGLLLREIRKKSLKYASDQKEVTLSCIDCVWDMQKTFAISSQICGGISCSVPEAIEHSIIHCPARRVQRSILIGKLNGLGEKKYNNESYNQVEKLSMVKISEQSDDILQSFVRPQEDCILYTYIDQKQSILIWIVLL